MIFSHGLNKAFLVSDSCRATVRNGNSISVDFTENTFENDENDLSDNLAVVFFFLTLQNKHNIRTLSVNINKTKNTTHYVLDTTMHRQNTNNINKTSAILN